MDEIGIIGAILFFIKIGIHAYIMHTIDKKYSFSTFGQFTDLFFFLPVMDDVSEKLKNVKKAANIIYVIAVILICIFLIGINTFKGN